MRIDNHIFETLLIGIIFTPILLIILPFFNLTNFSLIFFFIFFGLFCGVVYPDTDCCQSKIFKGKPKKRTVGWQHSYQTYMKKKNLQDFLYIVEASYLGILRIVGYLFRYVIYYPTLKLIRSINNKYVKQDEFKIYEIPDVHRGISHALFGIIFATGLFFLLFSLANLCFKFTGTTYVVLSTITFFIAGNIHLLQDSISKSGIKWFYPFKEKHISGEYSAFVDDSRMTLLNLSLIGVIILNYFALYYILNNSINRFLGFSIIFLLPFISLSLIFFVLFRSYQVKITNN